ncbi:MAG: TonB-dependent receptor [Gemmatimonadota bacterium]|jgi:vitamin B12 transporter
MNRYSSHSPPTALAVAFFLAVSGAVLAGGRASAQVEPDTFALDPIVVTATRLPAPKHAVPATVTVFDGARLRAAGIGTVAEALRSVPGLSVVRSGAPGALTSLFVRGAESDHVQVLIDGAPLNDPGGAIDLAHLTTADVEHIEVVRGPASVLWGTDAAAGVVQIFTRRGGGPMRVEASLGGSLSPRVGPQASGKAGGLDAEVSVGGGAGIASWRVTAASTRSAGAYAWNNAYRSTTLTGRLDLAVSADTRVALTVRRGDGVFRYPTDGSGALVDRNQFRDDGTLTTALEARHAVRPGLELRASLATNATDHTLDDAPDGPADTTGFFASRIRDRLRRQRADLSADVGAGRSVLTIGATAERQSGRNETESSSAFGPYSDRSANARASGAGYVQLVTTPRTGVTLTAGSRVEHSSRFGTLATWRVGVNLRGAPGGLRIAAGTGFKEPTFYENFATGFVRGNPALEPERTRSAELGIERDLAAGHLHLEATGFIQQLRNLIQYTASPPETGESNYFNVGEARAAGLELAARVNPGGGLGIDVAWTWLRTRVTDAGFGTDHAFLQDLPLLRRPGRQGNITARWTGAVGRFRAGLAFVGRRDDLEFSDPADYAGARVSLPARALLDLACGHRIGRRFDLLVRVDNALDQRYEEVRGFPALRRTVGIEIRAGTD